MFFFSLENWKDRIEETNIRIVQNTISSVAVSMYNEELLRNTRPTRINNAFPAPAYVSSLIKHYPKYSSKRLQ